MSEAVALAKKQFGPPVMVSVSVASSIVQPHAGWLNCGGQHSQPPISVVV